MSRAEDGKNDRIAVLASVGPFMGYGMTLAMAVAFFFFAGWFVDGWLGSTPLFSILGALVGAAGGFYYMIHHLSMASGTTVESGGGKWADRDAAAERRPRDK